MIEESHAMMLVMQEWVRMGGHTLEATELAANPCRAMTSTGSNRNSPNSCIMGRGLERHNDCRHGKARRTPCCSSHSVCNCVYRNGCATKFELVACSYQGGVCTGCIVFIRVLLDCMNFLLDNVYRF